MDDSKHMPENLKQNKSHLIATPRTAYCAMLSQLGMVHDSVEITKKMQPCNRIYYSNVY